MDYESAFIALIAYCQRNEILPRDSTVYEALSDIIDIPAEEIEESLFW